MSATPQPGGAEFALVLAGVVERTEDGKYLFPFDRVKVQFEFAARAAA